MTKFVMRFAEANYGLMASGEGEWDCVVKVFDRSCTARICAFALLLFGYCATLWGGNGSGSEFWGDVSEDGFGFGVDGGEERVRLFFRFRVGFRRSYIMIF